MIFNIKRYEPTSLHLQWMAHKKASNRVFSKQLWEWDNEHCDDISSAEHLMYCETYASKEFSCDYELFIMTVSNKDLFTILLGQKSNLWKSTS